MTIIVHLVPWCATWYVFCKSPGTNVWWGDVCLYTAGQKKVLLTSHPVPLYACWCYGLRLSDLL